MRVTSPRRESETYEERSSGIATVARPNRARGHPGLVSRSSMRVAAVCLAAGSKTRMPGPIPPGSVRTLNVYRDLKNGYITSSGAAQQKVSAMPG